MSDVRFEVDWIRCDGYGLCGDLLPDLIALDDWRYPILQREPIDRERLDRRAARGRLLSDEGRSSSSRCPPSDAEARKGEPGRLTGRPATMAQRSRSRPRRYRSSAMSTTASRARAISASRSASRAARNAGSSAARGRPATKTQ